MIDISADVMWRATVYTIPLHATSIPYSYLSVKSIHLYVIFFNYIVPLPGKH